MIEGINQLAIRLIENYKEFINFFPDYFGTFLNFLILVLLVVFYSIFIWKGYKYISKKDPLGLNLNQYNKYDKPIL